MHLINVDHESCESHEKPAPFSNLAAHRRLITIKYMGEAMWILSEATWILLLPQVCMPTSFLALVFISWAAALDFRESKQPGVWFPSAMQAFWLFWNMIWMLDEVFWDEPDEQTPWAQTPLFGENEKRYAAVQEYCKKFFFLAPLLWISAVLYQLFKGISIKATKSRSTYCWRSNVRELLWHSGYIAMWSSTDGFWACGYLWSATASAVVTILMILASTVEQTSNGIIIQADRTDVVWILWTLANLMWIYLELFFKDSIMMRYLASLVCFVSLFLLSVSWDRFEEREKHEAASCDDLAVALNQHDALAVK